MDHRVFVAVWALGYDYMPDLAMHAVFVIAIIAGVLVRKAGRLWQTLRR